MNRLTITLFATTMMLPLSSLFLSANATIQSSPSPQVGARSLGVLIARRGRCGARKFSRPRYWWRG